MQVAILKRIDVAAIHFTDESSIAVLECGYRFGKYMHVRRISFFMDDLANNMHNFITDMQYSCLQKLQQASVAEM